MHFILNYCVTVSALPKLLYTLRCSLCFSKDVPIHYDGCIRDTPFSRLMTFGSKQRYQYHAEVLASGLFRCQFVCPQWLHHLIHVTKFCRFVGKRTPAFRTRGLCKSASERWQMHTQRDVPIAPSNSLQMA
jgi:hypothetical protein